MAFSAMSTILQHPEFHVLLKGSGGAISELRPKFGVVFGGQPFAFVHQY